MKKFTAITLLAVIAVCAHSAINHFSENTFGPVSQSTTVGSSCGPTAAAAAANGPESE